MLNSFQSTTEIIFSIIHGRICTFRITIENVISMGVVFQLRLQSVSYIEIHSKPLLSKGFISIVVSKIISNHKRNFEINSNMKLFSFTERLDIFLNPHSVCGERNAECSKWRNLCVCQCDQEYLMHGGHCVKGKIQSITILLF